MQMRTETAVAILATAAGLGLLIVLSLRIASDTSKATANNDGQANNAKLKISGDDEDGKLNEAKAKPGAVTTKVDSRAVTAEKDENEKKADLSQVESTLGTKAFKAGSFRLAIEHFTRAIDLCPAEDLGSKKVMLNNRAAAREKLGEWNEAEADASAALVIDPTYRRAITRRAKARENLGKLKQALEDLALWKTMDVSTLSEEDRVQVSQSMDRLAQTLAKGESEALWRERKASRLGVLNIPGIGTCKQFYYAFSLDARAMKTPPSLISIKEATEQLDSSAPKYGDHLFKISMMYKARLELEEALKLWKLVASTSSASVENQARSLSEVATLYHLSGDHTTAKEKLLAAQRLHETSQVWIKLAALAVEEGDFDVGRELIEKGAKSISNGPDAKNERADYNFHLSAITCLEAANLTSARDFLDSAIHEVPDYGLAYMQLGVVLFRMSLVTEALVALEQACRLVPELAEVHNFHGEVLMSVNRREEAIEKFAEASKADEHCSLPLLNRGVMFMSNETGAPPTPSELENAIEMFNKAVSIDPTNEIAFIHRASYYCHVGDLKTALANYDKAIELTKSVPYMTEYLGFRNMCAADLAVQERLLSDE